MPILYIIISNMMMFKIMYNSGSCLGYKLWKSIIVSDTKADWFLTDSLCYSFLV